MAIPASSLAIPSTCTVNSVVMVPSSGVNAKVGIATLGTLNAWGVALAALFIGLIDTGSQTVSRALGVPAYLGDVIQATLLLVTLGMLLLQSYRIRRSREAG